MRRMNLIESPLVSIIILNYNGVDMTTNCLRSVLKTDYPNFEVIALDNGSTDGSAEVLKQEFGGLEQVHLLFTERNLGFAGGNNFAAKIARGKYLAFLSNDTSVDPRWLQDPVLLLESHENVGAVQSKLRSLSNPHIIDCTGGFIDSYCWSLRRGEGEVDVKQYDAAAEIFYAVGAALFTRADLFFEVGGFDTDLLFYYEDVDFSWRIRLLGFKVLLAPRSIVYHGVAKTMGRTPLRMLYLGCRNSLLVFVKNSDLRTLLARVTGILSLIGLFCLLAFVRGDSQRGLTYVRAVTWNLRNFDRTWKKRSCSPITLPRVFPREINKLRARTIFPLILAHARMRKPKTHNPRDNIEKCLTQS